MSAPDEPQLHDRYRQLQRYVRWSDYDVQRVRAAGPQVTPYLPEVIEDFYEEIQRHHEARIVITGGREQIRRLKGSLRAWIEELFSGEYDRDYVRRRWQVGRRHVEIGLDRMFASAAFARLRSRLISALRKGWQGTVDELLDSIESLNRLLDLDLGLIEYAYQTESLNQQQATGALYQSEERLRAIVNTCVDGIISIRHDGSIETFNPAAEAMFGYSANEVAGRNVSVLMPSPYREEHDRYITNYLRTGAAKIIGIGREAVGRRKDGTTFPIELTVSQIDHLQMFIGIVHDISQRKLTQQRMLQSERLAAIGQMITGLAHESRNAFQRSQACLEMLELEVQDQPEAATLVSRIQRAHDHLHHLYEEVRDYAAPITLDKQACDLARLWRDTWAHLEVARKEKRVTLRDDMPEIVDRTCHVDEITIEQLFRNILENAIAACPTDGKIVVKCANATLDGRDALRVTIQDNGPGFASESAQKVFEPFYTTKTKGTGLGMAIAERIVDAHGGCISVGNWEAGAEVVVTLPRHEP